MNKRNRLTAIWERYIEKEIKIEFKACLYFFCILFFYSMYRLLCGIYDASILHMAEMIFLTYAMGYVQVYLLSNFDECETIRRKELSYMVLCTVIYTGLSFLFRWFDRNPAVSIGFACYILIVYFCAFLIYKAKRRIDEKILNDDLKAFQERNGGCNNGN